MSRAAFKSSFEIIGSSMKQSDANWKFYHEPISLLLINVHIKWSLVISRMLSVDFQAVVAQKLFYFAEKKRPLSFAPFDRHISFCAKWIFSFGLLQPLMMMLMIYNHISGKSISISFFFRCHNPRIWSQLYKRVPVLEINFRKKNESTVTNIDYVIAALSRRNCGSILNLNY